MASNIIMYKRFDATKITCDELMKNKAGGNQVNLKYDTTLKNIVIQTPVVSAPFGLSEYMPDMNTDPKYSIDVSFKGYEEDNKISTFLTIIQNIDKQMIDLAVENSHKWFGKTMSREVVEELYRPLVKPSKQPEKYAPTLKCKIRNVSRVEAFTKDREVYDVMNLQPGCTIKLLLGFSPVWFVNKQFGITLNVLQMEINSQPSGKLTGFAFCEDDE